MTTNGLTDLQRQAMECMEGARSAGVALSAHVRSRGLNLRGPLGLPVERDLHFEADKPISAYATEAHEHRRIRA